MKTRIENEIATGENIKISIFILYRCRVKLVGKDLTKIKNQSDLNRSQVKIPRPTTESSAKYIFLTLRTIIPSSLISNAGNPGASKAITST